MDGYSCVFFWGRIPILFYRVFGGREATFVRYEFILCFNWVGEWMGWDGMHGGTHSGADR